jgi:uncharacterized protein
MKLNLTALPKGISSFADEGHVELPEEAIRWHQAPQIKGFVDRQNDRFIIRANVSAALVLYCSRCLDEHVVPLKDELTLVVLSDYGSGSDSFEDDSIIHYPQDDVLKLDDPIYRLIILNLPMKSLCSEECKGICTKCGVNLNRQICTCLHDDVDPRWEKLRTLKPTPT